MVGNGRVGLVCVGIKIRCSVDEHTLNRCDLLYLSFSGAVKQFTD
jgi:hypothetical protein